MLSAVQMLTAAATQLFRLTKVCFFIHLSNQAQPSEATWPQRQRRRLHLSGNPRVARLSSAWLPLAESIQSVKQHAD